jgi:hypothetical protein
MRAYMDIIEESLALPFPLKWSQRSMDRWYGTFMAGDEEYFLMCYHIEGFDDPDRPGDHRTEGKWYDMAFSLTRDSFAGTRVIGTEGMQFRIFATVISGIRQFVHEVHPELIMLSASKENVNRLPLYKRMARRFGTELKALGYEPIDAPDHQYANVRAVADTLAWRRSGEWKPKINEGVEHITDEQGNPVVFYHGTNADFDQFDNTRPPRHYETDKGKMFFTSSEENARAYADDTDDWGRQTKPGRVIRAHINLTNPYVVDCEGAPDEEWDAWGKLYANEAEAEGHDGIIIHNEDGSEKLIVAFHPEQIKQL